MTAADGDPPVRDDPTNYAIADTASELADVLEDLQTELRESQRTGPFGFPAPPTPRELLRFTDDYAIPFMIAVLETNIRALRLLQGAIRLVDTGEQARQDARSTRDRAVSFSQSTLSRLDDVLSELEDSTLEVSNGEYPRNPEARTILQEARDLRRELTEALAGSTRQTGSSQSTSTETTTIPIRDGSRSDASAERGEKSSTASGVDEPTDTETTESASGTESGVHVDVEG